MDMMSSSDMLDIGKYCKNCKTLSQNIQIHLIFKDFFHEPFANIAFNFASSPLHHKSVD